MSGSQQLAIENARLFLDEVRVALATNNLDDAYVGVTGLWLYARIHSPRAPLAAIPITASELAALVRQIGQHLQSRIATGAGHEALNKLWEFATRSIHDGSWDGHGPSWEMLGTTEEVARSWVRDYAQRYYWFVRSGQRPELTLEILRLPNCSESNLDTLLGTGAAAYLAQSAIDVIESECLRFSSFHPGLERQAVVLRLIDLAWFIEIRVILLDRIPGYQAYSRPQLEQLLNQIQQLQQVWRQARDESQP